MQDAFFWYGYCQLSLWGYIISTLVLTHITIVSVTLYLHRAQAHRAIQVHPALAHFFRFWVWLTTSQLTNEWVAVHRCHHAKVETEDDPHSPWHFGILRVLFCGSWLYRDSAQKKEILDQYSHGTPNDWIERNLYQRFHYSGLFIMLGLDLILFGIFGVCVWAVQMIWIPFHAAGVINGVAHYIGYRNFECPDGSTNISPWAFWIGGEELHNNHHAFPDSAKFSIKWYEFDLGYLYIQILKCFGLVQVKRLPPVLCESQLLECKTDIAKWKILVANRLRIMEQFAQQVVWPQVKNQTGLIQDKLRGFSSINEFVKTMLRHSAIITSEEKGRVESNLGHLDHLRCVYKFYKNLEKICHRTRAGQKEMFTALREWCNEAEKSKIQCLEGFSTWLQEHFLRNFDATPVS